MSSEKIIKTVEDVEANLDEIEEIIVIAEPSNSEKAAKLNNPVDPIKRKKAFDLYMANKRFDDIAKATGVKKGTLLSWAARENWSEERKKANAINVADVLETKKFLLNDITVELLEGISSSIKNAKDSKGGFNAKDFPRMLAAVGNLEKLARLSLGMATSISEERSKRATFTLPTEHLKQVTQVQIQDPFQLTENKPHPEENDDEE